MRALSVSVGALLALSAAAALAQESLCNPCVDPPVIRRDNFVSPGATNVIRAEDMRNLGVVSVADLIDQLQRRSEEEQVRDQPPAEQDDSESPSADEAAAEPERPESSPEQ